MNNTSRYLIYASLVSLAFAVLGGLWLVWHTIEEGRALERQNRELQASLEASRIRVENFCEYPSDVLCRVDERSGTVAGALPGNIPGLDELVGTSAQPKDAISAPDASPAKALENIQKVAKAQSAVEAKAGKAATVAAEKPAPAVTPVPEKAHTKDKEKKADVSEPQDQKAKDIASPASVAPEASPKPAEATPEKTTLSAKSEAVAEAGDTKKEENKVAQILTTPETKKEATPASPAPAEISASEAAPSYAQEFSGKLSDALVEKTTAAKKKKSASKVSKKSSEKRMSWSRVEQDGDIFAFTIAGAGDSLKATGKLLPSPWRYELELDGLFDVRQHKGIANRLVKAIKIQTRNGKTVIQFQLKAKPYKSTLHQIDARTISVRIR